MRSMLRKFKGLGLLRDRIEDDRDPTEMNDMENFIARVWAEAVMTCVMAEHITISEVRNGTSPCATCTGDALDANAVKA